MMAIPPVFVGLMSYLLLSRSSPLGFLDLLYTPYAMTFAQVMLLLPISISLTIEVVQPRYNSYRELFESLCFTKSYAAMVLLTDCFPNFIFIALTVLGRAMSEVGAVMIVGGNINHYTRVLTTTIALETSRGNLQLAVILGVILLVLTMIVHICATFLKAKLKYYME